MTKQDFTTVKLETGEIRRYDFGQVRLHADQTDDPLNDEVFLLEKEGRFVILESPCFTESAAALSNYIKGKDIAGMLVSYHGAGASFLPEVPKYATANAVEYSRSGGGKGLIDQFAKAFGPLFDSGVHTVDHIVEEGPLQIGGVAFIIRQTEEAFDVEIPEINAVYTHMLGHDCHSIVAGASHADERIAALKEDIQRGYDLILTSHHAPEDRKDAQTKIDYLEQLKAAAARCADAAEFKAEINKLYPAYGGENYLDMTAGFFFA